MVRSRDDLDVEKDKAASYREYLERRAERRNKDYSNPIWTDEKYVKLNYFPIIKSKHSKHKKDLKKSHDDKEKNEEEEKRKEIDNYRREGNQEDAGKQISKEVKDDLSKDDKVKDDEIDNKLAHDVFKDTGNKIKESKAYGKALLPGEGSAIASYVQNEVRVPRRGEVGWTGDKIEELENLGYVMSGSRHWKMNAVRLRKENQVISAEEKKKLLEKRIGEKREREDKLIEELKEMVEKNKAMRKAK